MPKQANSMRHDFKLNFFILYQYYKLKIFILLETEYHRTEEAASSIIRRVMFRIRIIK